jgi:hypothetical protein
VSKIDCAYKAHQHIGDSGRSGGNGGSGGGVSSDGSSGIGGSSHNVSAPVASGNRHALIGGSHAHLPFHPSASATSRSRVRVATFAFDLIRAPVAVVPYWLHGKMRNEAAERLVGGGPDGTFVVRRRADPNEFALSVMLVTNPCFPCWNLRLWGLPTRRDQVCPLICEPCTRPLPEP